MKCCFLSCTPRPLKMGLKKGGVGLKGRKFFPFRVDPFTDVMQNKLSFLP